MHSVESLGYYLLYIAFLFNSGLSHPSILSWHLAVLFWIKQKDWLMVNHSYLVSQLLKGLRTLILHPQKHKFPVTPNLACKLSSAFPRATWNRSIACLLFWKRLIACLPGIFLLTFHALLQVGDLCSSWHALRLSDVSSAGLYSHLVLRLKFQCCNPGM